MVFIIPGIPFFLSNCKHGKMHNENYIRSCNRNAGLEESAWVKCCSNLKIILGLLGWDPCWSHKRKGKGQGVTWSVIAIGRGKETKRAVVRRCSHWGSDSKRWPELTRACTLILPSHTFAVSVILWQMQFCYGIPECFEMPVCHRKTRERRERARERALF